MSGFLFEKGITVLGDRVVVRPLKPEDYEAAGGGLDRHTPTGLLVPEAALQADLPATLGEVVGLGDLYERAPGILMPFLPPEGPPVLELGDHVLHSLYVGQKIEVAGEQLRSMRWGDVLMVVPRAAD